MTWISLEMIEYEHDVNVLLKVRYLTFLNFMLFKYFVFI